MSANASLKKIVAELIQVDPDTIESSFSLKHPKLLNSASRGVLAAAIQREFGIYSSKVFTAAQYWELETAVFGTTPVEGGTPNSESAGIGLRTVADSIASTSVAVGVRVGVDIEMVESMPEASDFWIDPFYRTHFTDAEIAYCVRQPRPREHFAARWCAKEALGKCDARFMAMDPTSVQIGQLSDGRPVLEFVGASAVPNARFAVSLSHTPLIAIAVVVAEA